MFSPNSDLIMNNKITKLQNNKIEVYEQWIVFQDIVTNVAPRIVRGTTSGKKA